jgi:hypothetical protein
LRRSPVRGWFQVGSSPVDCPELLVRVQQGSGSRSTSCAAQPANKDVNDEHERP